MLDGSQLGSSLSKAILDETVAAYTSFVNIAEAKYVLCRKIGHGPATKAAEDLVASGYVSVCEDAGIYAVAARFKCERALSLCDCYTFAVAETTVSRPLFVYREKELLGEIARKPFELEPVFLT